MGGVNERILKTQKAKVINRNGLKLKTPNLNPKA